MNVLKTDTVAERFNTTIMRYVLSTFSGLNKT